MGIPVLGYAVYLQTHIQPIAHLLHERVEQQVTNTASWVDQLGSGM